MLRPGDVRGKSGTGDSHAFPRPAHDSPRANVANPEEGRQGERGFCEKRRPGIFFSGKAGFVVAWWRSLAGGVAFLSSGETRGLVIFIVFVCDSLSYDGRVPDARSNGSYCEQCVCLCFVVVPNRKNVSS